MPGRAKAYWGTLWKPSMCWTRTRASGGCPEPGRVSITVDPARDTTKALAAYAAERGATRDRWLFLTGEKQALRDLCMKGFKLPLDETGGTPSEPIAHSTRFVLVDKAGEIRGYYEGTEDDDLNRLATDAKTLL